MTFFIGDVEVFRDPVHGFIQVDEVERDIINTKAFQRLRNISQLAFTKYVYHGAEHSRFGHSLGVMEFATKVFEKLHQKYSTDGIFPFTHEEYPRYWRLIRLATLLHDIGHGPFSHAIDNVFPEHQGHEDMTTRIIKETTIGQIIDSRKPQGISAEQIVDLLSEKTVGKEVFLHNILSGPFDVDKMDYLLRDSLYTGVSYGKFDWERLLHMFALYNNPDSGTCDLAIEHGGIHAAEAMVLARYFMFTQVYFHHIRRIYDLHLLEFLKQLKDENEEFRDMFGDPNKFIEWDDGKLKNILFDHHSIHAKAICNRKHFKLMRETKEHPEESEQKKFKSKYEDLKNNLKDVLLDEDANKHPYKYAKEDVRVLSKGNEPPRKFKNESKLVASLRPISVMRIYVPEEQRDDAEAQWKRI